MANKGASATSGGTAALRSFLDFNVLPALGAVDRAAVFFGFGFVLPFRDFATAARAGRAESFFRTGRAEDVRFVCFAKTWCS